MPFEGGVTWMGLCRDVIDGLSLFGLGFGVDGKGEGGGKHEAALTTFTLP